MAAVAVLFCSAAALATKVRADFSGAILVKDVIFAESASNPETFSGFYIFDTENNPNKQTESQVIGGYNWLCFELLTPNLVSFSNVSLLNQIEVANDNVGRDWYKVTGRTSSDTGYQLLMQDETATVFSDTSLPTSVDLSDFDSLIGLWRTTSDLVIDEMIGTLDTLTFREVETCDCGGSPPSNGIPTPAALPAGLALLVGLAFNRRRRR